MLSLEVSQEVNDLFKQNPLENKGTGQARDTDAVSVLVLQHVLCAGRVSASSSHQDGSDHPPPPSGRREGQQAVPGHTAPKLLCELPPWGPRLRGRPGDAVDLDCEELKRREGNCRPWVCRVSTEPGAEHSSPR